MDLVPRSEPTFLAITAGIGLLVGLAGGNWLLAGLVALGLYTARQVWITHILARALRTKERLEPPFPGGAWNGIFQVVRSLQSRSRKRKRRLSRFVSRFRKAAAALPDAVVILEGEQRIQWRNPAAVELLGLPRDGGLGSAITEHIRDPVFGEYLSSEETSRPIIMPAPGSPSIMLSLLVTPFGRRRERILVARDVTRAYHMDRAQKDFVANVSHELRTPLTVFSGNLEMLAESVAEEESSRTAIRSLRSNVDRMRVLVADLLTLSRLQMDGAERSEEVVDVPSLLDAIIREGEMLAASASSQHVLQLEAEPGLWLMGHESELRSAFSNLVHNAIRHTPPRSTIRVTWSSSGSGACLRVDDNGPGIASRHIPRLTERFYRVDESRSTDTGGTGLGLAIVNQVLEHHDASLSIDSREGAGTTFQCLFPVARIARDRGGEPCSGLGPG